MAKKEPDKLAQEVHQALAAGMSYGKWKAMQEPVKIEPKNLPIGIETKTCAYCGAEFYSEDPRKKYCGIRCRQKRNSETAVEKYWQNKQKDNP